MRTHAWHSALCIHTLFMNPHLFYVSGPWRPAETCAVCCLQVKEAILVLLACPLYFIHLRLWRTENQEPLEPMAFLASLVLEVNLAEHSFTQRFCLPCLSKNLSLSDHAITADGSPVVFNNKNEHNFKQTIKDFKLKVMSF